MMEDNPTMQPEENSNPTHQTTRGESRIPYMTELEFQADHGAIFHGHTSDVSYSGAFLNTQQEPLNIQVGDVGVAAITITEANKRSYNVSFPCIVARVTPKGLGLNFESMEPEETELDVDENLSDEEGDEEGDEDI
ncbi:MAG: PilZ domain-containing protein [Magnetococcus sp. DMHC-6]